MVTMIYSVIIMYKVLNISIGQACETSQRPHGYD